MSPVGSNLTSTPLTFSVGYKDYSTKDVQLNDYLVGKKTIILAVPGAFTPGCSKSHLPSFVNNFDALKEKGVDHIICTATNDANVMFFWGEHLNVGDKVLMLSDPTGALAEKMGTLRELNGSVIRRSERYTAIFEDGVCTHYFPGVDTDGNKTPEVAWAPNVMKAL